ncbi:MAG: hypothetical protein ACI8TP_002494 [Acidimicrobiales bacterium]|jgi:hypothetical protein
MADDGRSDPSADLPVPATPSSDVLPFDGLVAPAPLSSTPPEPARWLAFAGILIGGLLGGLIGYGVGDLLTGNELWAAVGALAGGLGGAIGVGIVSALTLRAMNEWKAVQHPEANAATKSTSADLT